MFPEWKSFIDNKVVPYCSPQLIQHFLWNKDDLEAISRLVAVEAAKKRIPPVVLVTDDDARVSDYRS